MEIVKANPARKDKIKKKLKATRGNLMKAGK